MRASLLLLPVAALALVACGSGDDSGAYVPPPLPDGGSVPVDAGSIDATASDGPPPILEASVPETGSNLDGAMSPDSGPSGPCVTTFSFVPPPGTSVQTLSVTGEWNQWAQPGVPMVGPDLNGAYSAQVALAPGMVAYKLLLNGQWLIDPGAWLRKFTGTPAVENSAVMVVDCHVPTLSLASQTITRASSANGRYVAQIRFQSGRGGPALDPASVTATLRKDGTNTTLPAPVVNAGASSFTVDVSSLADGKYTVFANAKDRAGQAPSEPLRLVFWIEPETFDWRDAVLYMTMVDRFQDGDPSNDAKPTANVDPRVDFQGGDLQGITARIQDGTFDQLGVRALWLSPFQTNPADPWLASDGVHLTMGYHGYWAIKARQVDPRIGGEAALHALVTAAHAHGIRVIQDFMVGDVHQEHEYVTAHPDWFQTAANGACVCGTANCDWTVHRLDCVFASYLPRVDWTNPAVSQQWGDDAVWWVDTFDLDGFRIDAVKQVQDDAITNVSWRLRHEFESSGLKFFMTGETAMGWSDCTQPDCPGNEQNYGIINEYIGPFGLDGSFDFVLYYAVPSNVFMNDNQGMIHADYWTQASQWEYRAGSIMSPYVGSQDTPRFATLADTSGGNALAGNQWSNVAGAPTTADAYGRAQLAMEWLLTIPGAPMIYYGDEYGQYGSADPNNRVMWRGGGSTLTANEQATLALVRKLGTARKALLPLRRGLYVPVSATQTALVFARQASDGSVALVAINRATTAQTVTAALPATLGIASGATLHDHLGGSDVSVAGASLTVNLAARGAAIFAP